MMAICDSPTLFMASLDVLELNLAGLAVMVVVQIAAFQFLFIRMSNILPRQMLGSETGPESVAPIVSRYYQGLGNGRRAAGAVLILAALAIVFVVPFADPEHREWGLTIISLLSTTVLLGGYIRDVRRINTLRSVLEPISTGTASLERRSLFAFYPRRLELLPLLVFALTIALTVVYWPHGGETSLIRILTLPALQLVFIGASLYLAGKLATQRWPVAQGALAQADDPGAVLDHAQAYRRQDLQGLVYARAGMVFLMATWQGQWLYRWRGETFPKWLIVADDVALILVLLLFVGVLMTLPGIRKRR